MELKELVREKVLAEIVAERDDIILNQHQQILQLQGQVKQLTEKYEPVNPPPSNVTPIRKGG